jgi:hypothetical protein
VAGAATPHAGLLDGRGDAIIVDRKAFSECHFLNSLLYAHCDSGPEIIDAALTPRREIA